MPTPRPARTLVRGKPWTARKSIDTAKFDAIAGAILASLEAKPIAFGELSARVERLLPRFDGSVSWYTITCVRELEVRGQVVRQEKPVRYHLAGH